jgi:hypothetical protein
MKLQPGVMNGDTSFETNETESLGDIVCRICLEECQRAEVIAPCSCRGSSKWVHRACLDGWRYTREDRAFSSCTECRAKYKLVPRHQDSESAARNRKCVYFYRVARDITVGISCIQFIVLILSGMVYLLDSKGSYLINSFGASKHFLLFYYSFGAFLFFAAVGFIGLFLTFTGRGPALECRYCIIHPNCCSCCVYSTECFSGEWGTCCALESCGECLPVLIIVLVVFAIIGVFVAFVLGMSFISETTGKHLHILEKRGLVDDFIGNMAPAYKYSVFQIKPIFICVYIRS